MKDLETRYQETLDWIYSWIDFSMSRHVDESHRFFKLDRMNRLMALLDWPNRHYPCVHVAGTKGKGSTASFIASALRACGYKTGLYTSPHLEEFRERIQINGEQISVSELVDLADQMRPRTEIVKDVTTFELTTAIAFQYFANQQIDIAVLEVGLGGRLDATNIVDPWFRHYPHIVRPHERSRKHAYRNRPGKSRHHQTRSPCGHRTTS